MDKKLYILTYEHGGYILWKDHLKVRLSNLDKWLEKYPKLKVGLDYEAFTFDEFAKSEPELLKQITDLVEKYPDRVGLGSTTYGQPLSLTISEESNARQLIFAVRTNMKFFGKTPSVYSISEFALNNQTPQLATLTGYKAAILRSHVMGYGYPKTFKSAWGRWIGRDKTELPAVPTYDGQGRGFNCCTVDNWILSRWPNESSLYSIEDFEKMFSEYEPLLASRYDDVCQDIEPVTRYTQEKENCQYVLLEEIPEIYGEAKDELVTGDNDFHVQMPWGYCGNEIFNAVREAEVEAVQAEKLNAVAVMLGGKPEYELLDEAWKYALISQHHDITICGLTQHSRKFLPMSLERSKKVKQVSLDYIASQFSNPDSTVAVAANLHSFEIDEWLQTQNGNIHIKLPPFTVKRLENDKTEYKYSYDEVSGILETPNYRLKLTADGIAFLDDIKTDRRIFDNGDGALFSATVENVDCLSKGEWNVKTDKNSAVAIQNGTIGGVPFVFEMRFNGDSERIDCKTHFTMHGEHVGVAGECHGLNKSVTVDGMTHEKKLNFNMHLNLKNSRKMMRDLPYSVSQWNGYVRDVEDYWYKTDKIIYDKAVTPEESFNSSTYLNGIYWVSLRDDEYGFAVMNRGCMGSVVRGNLLSVPLLYSNLYMCGTRILDGEFEDEFALLPFDSSKSDIDIHKSAVSYAYQPSVTFTEAGNGKLSELTAAKLHSQSGDVILTAMYPENDAVLARFCNYSDKPATAEFATVLGKLTAQTDLLGNITEYITNNELTFRPWEVKTVLIKK